MPVVKFPGVLKAVYDAAASLIKDRDPLVPSDLIFQGRTLFRSFDAEHVTIATTGSFSRRYANSSLVIRDQKKDQNRFSGVSNPAPASNSIPAIGGLYCSVDQVAQVNEILFYAQKDVVNPTLVKAGLAAPLYLPKNAATGAPNIDAALNRRCMVQIRLVTSVLAMDLSRHNKAAPLFLNKVASSKEVTQAIAGTPQPGRSMLDYLRDGEDCSVARGIGLAVAHSGYFKALQVTTVRPSDRSTDETGDNLVFFGQDGEQVPGLYIEKALLFPLKGAPQVLNLVD